MLNKIKALADEAIALQNKTRMEEVLREISAVCAGKVSDYGATIVITDDDDTFAAGIAAITKESQEEQTKDIRARLKSAAKPVHAKQGGKAENAE